MTETPTLATDAQGARIGGTKVPHYGVAAILTAAAIVLRLAIDPWVDDRPVLTLFLFPIIVSAYLGGLGPGLFAVLLVALSTNYWVIEPRGAINFDHGGDFVTWAALVVGGALASGLIAARREAIRDTGGSAHLEGRVQSGFVAALASLVIVGVVSHISLASLERNLTGLRNADRVIDAARSIIAATRDFETAVGRFVITGNEAQLASFESDTARAREELVALQGAAAGRAEVSAEVAELARLLDRRIEVARSVIVLRRRDTGAAQAAIDAGEGRRLIEEMRTTAARLERKERQVLETLAGNSSNYVAMSRTMIVLGATLAAAFLLAAIFVVRREFAGRRGADAALREAHALLEERVQERTAELAHSHDALRERERQLDGIVDSAMDAIVTTDEEQRIVLFNAAAERMFGWTSREMLGESLERLIPGRFRPGHANRVREFGQNNVTSRTMGGDAAIHGLRSNGREFPIEASISQAQRGGRTYFTAILRDITQRKADVDALRASEAQLRSVTDALPALIAHLGRDQRILYANQAYADWFGRSREELVGHHVEELLEGEQQRKAAEDIAAALAGETRAFDRSVLRASDGERRHVSGVMIPERAADGTVGGVYVLVNDLTERRRAEALLQRSQRMDSLGTLAGGIAHDFNNILPQIRGFAAMAGHDLPEGHPALEKLAQVEKAAARASDLVRRILAFSRPESGKATPRIDLASAVKDALELVRAALPAMIDIRTTFEPRLPEIAAEPTEIYQIVLNLLTNAAHAIGERPGMIDVRVARVEAEERAPGGVGEGSWVRLAISDDGAGMDAETQARIFDPFFTTKPVGQGTGLGLSIVHGIVKKLGGSIQLYSEPGRGARFQIDIPALAGGEGQRAASAKAIGGGRGQRLLYVDDEEALVFLATYMLKRLGYQVTGFTRAEEALAALRKDPGAFDAVITDLSMPGMSGFEVARAIHEIRADLPIVMASGYVRPEDEEKARAHGILRIFAKPNTVEEYARAIDRLFS